MMEGNLHFREHTQLRQIIWKQGTKISLVAGRSCGVTSGLIYQTIVPNSTLWVHLRF